MSKYKAVLFDLDGTVLDTNQLIIDSWNHLYKNAAGRECVPEEVIPTFGQILTEAVNAKFPGRDTEELVKIYRGYVTDVFHGEVVVFPGIAKMLDDLHAAGVKTAIVTSRLWSSLDHPIYKWNIGDKFDVIVSCADTKAHKPDPEPLFVGMQKLGVKPEESLYVGDTIHDLKCAHNAGLDFALVNWTICMPKEMRIGENKPEYEVDTPDDLVKIASK